MATKRKIEVFSAGCAACNEVIETVKRAACSSCEVTILDMKDINVASRAKATWRCHADRLWSLHAECLLLLDSITGDVMSGL